MDLCGKDKYEHVDKNTRGEKPTLALGDRSPADDHKAFGPGSTTLLFTAPAGDLEIHRISIAFFGGFISLSTLNRKPLSHLSRIRLTNCTADSLVSRHRALIG